MKAYREIKSIELADSHNLYEVTFEPLPSLEDVTYEDGTVEIQDLLLTKKEVLNDVEHLMVKGYGQYSGKQAWMLSDHLKRQVRKTMKKHELV
jgi:hypothetical protein